MALSSTRSLLRPFLFSYAYIQGYRFQVPFETLVSLLFNGIYHNLAGSFLVSVEPGFYAQSLFFDQYGLVTI